MYFKLNNGFLYRYGILIIFMIISIVINLLNEFELLEVTISYFAYLFAFTQL